MPPHPRIRSDQTVANFGASHNRHVIPGRSFGHFFHPPERLPAHFPQRHPVVAAPGRRLPMGNHGTECYLSKCPERSAGHRAQRDDGDRHALPGRHRRSQAAAAPAVVAAWQSAWAHLPTMASVCCAPDASTLWFSCGSILRDSRFSNASVNLLFTT